MTFPSLVALNNMGFNSAHSSQPLDQLADVIHRPVFHIMAIMNKARRGKNIDLSAVETQNIVGPSLPAAAFSWYQGRLARHV